VLLPSLTIIDTAFATPAVKETPPDATPEATVFPSTVIVTEEPAEAVGVKATLATEFATATV